MGIRYAYKTGVRATFVLLAAAWTSNADALLPDASDNPYLVDSQRAESSSLSPQLPRQNTPTMLDRVVNFEGEKLAKQRERPDLAKLRPHAIRWAKPGKTTDAASSVLMAK